MQKLCISGLNKIREIAVLIVFAIQNRSIPVEEIQRMTGGFKVAIEIDNYCTIFFHTMEHYRGKSP